MSKGQRWHGRYTSHRIAIWTQCDPTITVVFVSFAALAYGTNFRILLGSLGWPRKRAGASKRGLLKSRMTGICDQRCRSAAQGEKKAVCLPENTYASLRDKNRRAANGNFKAFEQGRGCRCTVNKIKAGKALLILQGAEHGSDSQPVAGYGLN